MSFKRAKIKLNHKNINALFRHKYIGIIQLDKIQNVSCYSKIV